MTLVERRKLYNEHRRALPYRRQEIIAELEADTTLHVTLIEVDDIPLTVDHAPGSV